MDDKRLFSSAFHASSSGNSGSRLPTIEQQQWNQSRLYATKLDRRADGQPDLPSDPLQDLQILLNRLITDGDVNDSAMTRQRQQQQQQQQQQHRGHQHRNQADDFKWQRAGQKMPVGTDQEKGGIKLRWQENSSRKQNYSNRRSDGFAMASSYHEPDRQGFASQDGGSYDHWFTDQRNAKAETIDHYRYRSDLGGRTQVPVTAAATGSNNIKISRRVPPSPSWPLNCPVNCRQQPVSREIEITDLRRQAAAAEPSGASGGSFASSTGWWDVAHSTGASGGSDTSGGGGRSRTVSYRREATLRASAEQLDHLSRRSGTSGSSTVLAVHRRSASDAAVQGRRVDDDSLDYDENIPAVNDGRDDGAWPNEAEAGMSVWYQPTISRDEAVAALRDAAPGSFIVRDSQTYPGAYGLALRVSQPPPAQPMTLRTVSKQDPRDSLVRHFLIEVSPGGGVRLRGCSNEPVFRSLAELIQCHSLTPLALPCCLRLPSVPSSATKALAKVVQRPQNPPNREHCTEEASSGRRGTTFKVLYFCTADVPVTGPTRSSSRQQQQQQQQQQKDWPHQAVSAAVGQVSASLSGGPRPIECRMRVSGRGVKLSGQGWHKEFRLAYAAEDCLACELDPAGRRFPDTSGGAFRNSSLFGLIVKKYGFYGDQTACLVLGGSRDSSATAIVDFVNRACLQSVDASSVVPVSKRAWTRHH